MRTQEHGHTRRNLPPSSQSPLKKELPSTNFPKSNRSPYGPPQPLQGRNRGLQQRSSLTQHSRISQNIQEFDQAHPQDRRFQQSPWSWQSGSNRVKKRQDPSHSQSLGESHDDMMDDLDNDSFEDEPSNKVQELGHGQQWHYNKRDVEIDNDFDNGFNVPEESGELEEVDLDHEQTLKAVSRVSMVAPSRASRQPHASSPSYVQRASEEFPRKLSDIGGSEDGTESEVRFEQIEVSLKENSPGKNPGRDVPSRPKKRPRPAEAGSPFLYSQIYKKKNGAREADERESVLSDSQVDNDENFQEEGEPDPRRAKYLKKKLKLEERKKKRLVTFACSNSVSIKSSARQSIKEKPAPVKMANSPIPAGPFGAQESPTAALDHLQQPESVNTVSFTTQQKLSRSQTILKHGMKQYSVVRRPAIPKPAMNDFDIEESESASEDEKPKPASNTKIMGSSLKNRKKDEDECDLQSELALERDPFDDQAQNSSFENVVKGTRKSDVRGRSAAPAISTSKTGSSDNMKKKKTRTTKKPKKLNRTKTNSQSHIESVIQMIKEENETIRAAEVPTDKPENSPPFYTQSVSSASSDNTAPSKQHETLKKRKITELQMHQKRIDLLMRQWKVDSINPENYQRIHEIKKTLMTKGIECKKYNYCLDQGVKSVSTTHATLKLSPGATELIIYNMKPVRKKKQHIDIAVELQTKSQSTVNQMLHDQNEDKNNDGVIDEFDYVQVKSKASCLVRDITGFFFGGFSSRFWMLRKHINSMGREQLSKIPFFAWECLTIESNKREANLVIKDEEDMKMLLQFLIFTLRTLDGKRRTAEVVLKSQKAAEISKYGENISEVDKQEIETRVEYEVFRKVYFRYLLMKVRMKISFSALQKCFTIKELLLFSILKAYQVQVKDGDKEGISYTREQEQLFSMTIGEEINLLDGEEGALKKFELIKNETEKEKLVSSITKKKMSILDQNLNAETKLGLKEVMSKDKADDMFKDIITQHNDQEIIRDDKSQWVKYKFNRHKLEKNLKKIRNFMKSNLFNGPRFLMAALKVYSIVKQIFLLEFELGYEILIPLELRQNGLPMSFQYYDPILVLISEKVSQDQRNTLAITKQLAIIFDKKKSLKGRTSELINGSSKKKKQKRVTVDVNTFEELQPGEINYHQSKHVPMLQRSNYVCLEDNPANLRFTAEEEKDEMIMEARERQYIREIDVQFLKPRDVEKKWVNILSNKGQFLFKLETFKFQGKVNTLMEKLDQWLDENMDQFHASDPTKSADENEHMRLKAFNRLCQVSEQIVHHRQFKYLTRQREKLKMNVDPKLNYNDKADYVNRKIEKNILFFKHNYQDHKKEIFELRKQLREVDRKLLKAQKKKTHLAHQASRRLQSEDSLSPLNPVQTKFDESDDFQKVESLIIEEDEEGPIYEFGYAIDYKSKEPAESDNIPQNLNLNQLEHRRQIFSD